MTESKKGKTFSFDPYINEKLQDSELRAYYVKNFLKEDIIQQLIKARKNAGLTQQELSEKLNIPQGNISRLERGKQMPTIDTILKIATELGYRVELNLKKII